MAKKRSAQAKADMDAQIDPAAGPGAPGPEPVAEDAAEGAAAPGAVLKKKDLLDRVAARSGVKKGEARDIVEAVLAELGAALARGEGLNLPPLGKAKVNRTRDSAQGEVLIVKLRRGGEGKETAQTPLADDAE